MVKFSTIQFPLDAPKRLLKTIQSIGAPSSNVLVRKLMEYLHNNTETYQTGHILHWGLQHSGRGSSEVICQKRIT